MTQTHGLQLERQPEEYRDRVTVDERHCNSCGKTKPWHQFGLNSGTPTGLSSKCFECERAYQRGWRAKQAALRASFELSDEQLDEAEDARPFETPQKRSAATRAANKKAQREATLAQARRKMNLPAARPAAPDPIPVGDLAALLAGMNGHPAEPPAELSETRLRYELAARILEGQGEILRLLIAR